MFEPGPPLDRKDSTKRFEALLAADTLSILALRENSIDWTPSIEALDETLKWLSGLFDALLKRRDAMKQIARERFNAGLPVTRGLFPDIFPMVVEHLQTMESEDMGKGIRKFSWAHVSHVCRQWRQTSLELATLWARDPIAFGERGLACVLDRAKDLPIDVVFDYSYDVPLENLFPRVKKLVCTQHNYFDFELLQDKVFPVLEEISLMRPLVAWGDNLPSMVEAHPRLRIINFTGVYISILPAMKSIVDLTLLSLSTGQFTTTELMKLLQDAHSLRNLVVSYNPGLSGRPAITPSSSLFPVISLSHLRSIRLDNLFLPEIRYVLGHLSLPYVTEARVSGVQYSHLDSRAYGPMILLLQAVSDAPRFAANLTCSIEHRLKKTYMTLTSPTQDIVEADLFCDVPDDPFEETMGNLVASTFATRISAIDIAVSQICLHRVSVQSWRSFFAPLEAVVQIVMPLFSKSSRFNDCLALEAFASALATPDESGFFLAPQMHTISLRANKDKLNAKLSLLLLRLVLCRRQHGMPLERIKIIEGEVSNFDKLVDILQQESILEFSVDWEGNCIVFS